MTEDFETHPTGTGKMLNLVDAQKQDIDTLRAMLKEVYQVSDDVLDQWIEEWRAKHDN